jgi:hypothetical protein
MCIYRQDNFENDEKKRKKEEENEEKVYSHSNIIYSRAS